jgi:thymidylate synthase (FAD)
MKAEYINHMGDDITVVNAARVSFDKESMNISPDEKDEKLIHYLAKHNHWTTFSHCMVTMRETIPIFVARQRFKHMVGFSYNEVSRRYVDDTPAFFSPDGWRKRPDASIKQGSSDEIIDLSQENWSFGDANSDGETVLKWFYEDVVGLYNQMIESGVAPEQARMVLPQSMFTSYYVTGSLAAWSRAYKLRIDVHAQKEIRDLAAQWDHVIEPLFPVSWKALTA